MARTFKSHYFNNQSVIKKINKKKIETGKNVYLHIRRIATAQSHYPALLPQPIIT